MIEDALNDLETDLARQIVENDRSKKLIDYI